jgi:hypothetical protein
MPRKIWGIKEIRENPRCLHPLHPRAILAEQRHEADASNASLNI